MGGPGQALQLLLAGQDGVPALRDGVPLSAVSGQVQRPERGALDFADPGGDPNSLADQGWGLIVPDGAVGDRLLEIAAPLLAKRAEDQGVGVKDVKVLRVAADPAFATMAGAAQWSKTVYDPRTGGEEDAPLYQLVLGNLDQVPLAIQQYQAATGGYVGRLHFDDEKGFEAYFDKLLASEKAGPGPNPGRLLFHTAHDGSAAVSAGFDMLMKPCLDLVNGEKDKGMSAAGDVASGGSPGVTDRAGLLDRAASAAPGVLFTLSHGLGGPAGGWTNEIQRRALQGAMCFAKEGTLAATDVAPRTFMPGGLWFMFACYGAGTPNMSAYQHWLQKLVTDGVYPGLGDVLSALKGTGPFVAALPQAVLANPNGPLAFIGHIDQAWTFSFLADGSPDKSRPGQFERVIDLALRGARVGIAKAQLDKAIVLADAEITSTIDLFAQNKTTPSGDDDVRLCLLWMTRQDLSGFILLGDPAARLQVTPPHRKPKS